MFRKILSLLIIILLTVTFLAGCQSFKYGPIGGGDKSALVVNNGGLAVKQGDYLYFINGFSDYNAEDPKANYFGEVLKGAIMRGKFVERALTDVEVVVPKKVMSSSVNNGFFVFGEWIYYVSPGIGTNNKGEVLTDYIDFMRTKIDGTKTDKIITVKGNTTEFKFTPDALIYFNDNKLISIDTTGKKFKENIIDEEVTAVLFPDCPVYNPANPKSSADYVFYVKEPEEESDLNNVIYSVNANGSDKKILIDKSTYTADDSDLNNIYTISLLGSSVTDNKLAIYYTKKSVAKIAEQERGLYGYEFDSTEVKFDKVNEKCFSLNKTSKIYPVSFTKGVFILDTKPSALARYKEEGDPVPSVTEYEFPENITMLGIVFMNDKDYAIYSSNEKVLRFPLDKSENAAVILTDTVKTGWSGPDFIDCVMFYINTTALKYDYTFMADLTTFDISDKEKLKNEMIGKMTQEDIDAKKAAEEKKEETKQ